MVTRQLCWLIHREMRIGARERACKHETMHGCVVWEPVVFCPRSFTVLSIQRSRRERAPSSEQERAFTFELILRLRLITMDSRPVVHKTERKTGRSTYTLHRWWSPHEFNVTPSRDVKDATADATSHVRLH